MNNQLMIESITHKLKQLPEEDLSQVVSYVEQLLKKSATSSPKKEFIRSLRGKYKNALSSSDAFSQQKQAEIDWEGRN